MCYVILSGHMSFFSLVTHVDVLIDLMTKVYCRRMVFGFPGGIHPNPLQSLVFTTSWLALAH